MSESDLGVWIALAAVPLLLATATAFTKSTVVLGALRQGLSAEALIPFPAILALALLVTVIVMGPTLQAMAIALDAGGGLQEQAAGSPGGWLPVLEPLRTFVVRHADAEEIQFFASLQGLSATDPLVVVPAFLVTELTEAFMIAVLIIVPFLLIDLVAAQALALMGMVQQPLPLLTLPIKLLLFLAVSGWDVVIGGLVRGYA